MQRGHGLHRPQASLPDGMISSLAKRFAHWFPSFVGIDRFERMRACAGALFGIVLTGLCSRLALGSGTEAIWMIGPVGASAVLLFAVPSSPLAQPWSVLGGNTVSALVGVTCALLTDDAVLGAALAGSVSIAAMFALRCLHPPGGAVALTAVLGGPGIHALGYGFVLVPVGLNSLLLLLTALFFNNATGRRYPQGVRAETMQAHDTRDPLPTARLGINRDDLDQVLARYNQVLDISPDDLETIFLETERQAYQRRFGTTQCAAIMSRDVVSVRFGTPLEEAWDLLHHHRLTALPVTDNASRVVGILTKADFIAHAGVAGATGHHGLGQRLGALLRPSGLTHSSKPEVVGQIMHGDVRTVTGDQPIVELVPLMSDAGLHSVPVVDGSRRLIGMITPSDMIAALYESSLAGPERMRLVRGRTESPGGKRRD